MVSSSGHWFNLGSLGKIVVLSDMMTLCQESCPLDTANVVAAARSIEKAGLGDRIQFVSLTIDPGRDTRRPVGRIPSAVHAGAGGLDGGERTAGGIAPDLVDTGCLHQEDEGQAAVAEELAHRRVAHLRPDALRRGVLPRPRRP